MGRSHLPSRRALLAGAAACALAPSARAAPSDRSAPPDKAARMFGPLGPPSWTPDSLQAAAAAKGLAYGTSLPSQLLARDRGFGRMVARECGLVVCGTEMKMATVMTGPGREEFSGADAIVRFARGNGQRLRGHTLVWHGALPDWAEPLLARSRPAQGEAFMRRWIEAIAGRYRGAIETWDVVNEVLAGYGPVRRADGLRETPWLSAIGPDYVDLAFRILHETDPAAAGTWNEDALEHDLDWMRARRTRVLKRLEGMRARGVPIRRFGIQSHLVSDFAFDAKGFRRFLGEVAQLGVGIEITELDIDDKAFPADEAARDRGVADLARRFLNVVLDEPAVLNVVTWGLFDGDTWMNDHPDHKRRDGRAQRPLPYDAMLRPKPFQRALHDAFRHAPDHAATRARLRRP